MTRAVFIYSKELWQHGHGPLHPLKPERLQRTYELLKAYGAFEVEGSKLVPARPATIEELCLFHTREYVNVVERLSRGDYGTIEPRRYNFGPGDNPIFDGMREVEGLKVGAALVGAELVTSDQADVAFSFSGGLHHAMPARASGFCVFNDAAVVIHWLLRRGLRVAYIDIDAHHGDGVQAAFYDSDRVLTISLHESGLYLFPGTGFINEAGVGAGRGYAINLPLAPYTDDATYLWAFQEIVPPLVGDFRPDVIVSQLGIDTHYLDPLTHLSLTTAGYTAVVAAIKELAPRWVALGGGGYDVTVVPRAWTLAYGLMLGREFPNELPAAYADKYGAGTLQDGESPRIPDWARERAQRQAEQAVESLKQILAEAGKSVFL